MPSKCKVRHTFWIYTILATLTFTRSTTVVDIMERNLVRVTSTTPAYVAIDLMITRQAYHAVSMSFVTNPCVLIVSFVDCA